MHVLGMLVSFYIDSCGDRESLESLTQDEKQRLEVSGLFLKCSSVPVCLLWILVK